MVNRRRGRQTKLRLIRGWRRINDQAILRSSPSAIIPPVSVVAVGRVTADEPLLIGYEGRIFRTGYYSKQDGLDCVWLVDDDGNYTETVDQEMIRTHFEVLQRSDETDFFGVDRPVIGPRIGVRTS
jgi:hypothetical protein